MKKFFATIATIALSASLSVIASGIEVQPTFQSRSNEQDRVWTGSFQLVWNDFMDKIVHNPIRFRESTPTMVYELNKQGFTANDISEKSYYKFAGKVKKNTKKQINKALKKKFKETSDLLDKMDLQPRNDKYIIYAMLKKDFEFINAFDKLEKSLFGYDQVTEYYGIAKHSSDKLGKGIDVLFYNSPDDFAIMLKTKTNDEVYLYKNSANKAFNYLWDDMFKKELTFKGEREFRSADEFKIPSIKFNIDKIYEELAKKRVMGTNLVIEQAMQTIKFEMNNKGVELKSEGGLSFVTCSLPHPEELVPRLFYLDNTFVIFLKEKDKTMPYFALRVHDITNYK